jgi:hypothetical protein
MNSLRSKVAIGWWGSLCSRNGTVGDCWAVHNVAQWLLHNSVDVDVISGPTWPYKNIVSMPFELVDARKYDMFIWVCGPLVPDEQIIKMISEFKDHRRIAVGVSKLAEMNDINSLFDRIIARDSMDEVTFDLALDPRYFPARLDPKLKKNTAVLLSLVSYEHWFDAQHDDSQRVARAFGEAMHNLRLDPIRFVDTRLTSQDPIEIARPFAETSFVLTTRLHGALLAIQNEVPFVAVEQNANSTKISTIIRGRLGWPCVLPIADIAPSTVEAAITQAKCLASRGAMAKFRESAERLSEEAVTAAGRTIMQILG